MGILDDNPVVRAAVDIFISFEDTVAVGLTGSRARDVADADSDIAFVVFVRNEVPPVKCRRSRYQEHHVVEFPYLDADHGVCIDDGLTIQGVRCESLWMDVPSVIEFLSTLDDRSDCDEALPGGLLRTVPLHDPSGTIEELKARVPAYSDRRAAWRAKKSLDSAHFSIYVLDWFEKAAGRNDYFCFFRHLRDVVEEFVKCVLALNRRWFCDEKRVTEILPTLELAPCDCAERLTSIMMHTGENKNLHNLLRNLKQLFGELAQIAIERYPDSKFPEEWQ